MPVIQSGFCHQPIMWERVEGTFQGRGRQGLSLPAFLPDVLRHGEQPKSPPSGPGPEFRLVEQMRFFHFNPDAAKELSPHPAHCGSV